MLFATLGKLDLLTVLILLGAAIVPNTFLLYAAMYLIVKGVIFGLMLRDFASKIDLICGIYLVILSFGLPIPVLHTLVLLWLLQKTIMTFVAIGFKTFFLYREYKTKWGSGYQL